MKKLQLVFLTLLSLMLVLPVCTINTEKGAVSEIDNRSLTDLSRESDDYSDMLDSYIKDRIGFRTEMITGFTTLNDVLFGEMIHPTYTYGEEGYVFFNYSPETVDEEFIDSFCRYLRMAQEYLETRGISFLYCLNPAKTTVYSRYLSAGYTYENRFNTALLEALDRYGVHYIENIELLTEKSWEEQVYNVKYDAGHWNDLGCFYGTNHLLSILSLYFPAVTPLTLDDFTIGTKLETTLPVSQYAIHEEVPLFTNNRLSEVVYLTDFYADIQLHPGYRNFVYAVYPDTSLPDVLFFHGSYYNGERTKFYQTSFHESIGVHNYQNFLNLDYYVNIFQPDIVLLETAEYATTRDYFSFEVLNEKILNTPYETVQEQPHESYLLLDLDPIIEIYEASALTTIEFGVDSSVAFGYALTEDRQFDLQITEDTAYLTIKTEDFTDAMEIALFSSRS